LEPTLLTQKQKKKKRRMDDHLNGMFYNIMSFVRRSKKNEQRHKKVFIDKSGKQVSGNQISDATSTYFQTTYQNNNRGSVISQVVGENGDDVALNCFSDRPRADIVFQQLVYEELKTNPAPDVVGAFREMLYFRMEVGAFLEKFRLSLRVSTKPHLEGLRVEFQSRLSLPRQLNDILEHVSFLEKERILKLVLDVELRRALTEVVPISDRLLMEQFLKSREATFGAQLSPQIQQELQHVSLDAYGDKDKCLLTFFYNIQQALGLNDTEMYQAPTSAKQLTIGKGVDRSHPDDFPHYGTLVRTERVKVASRRAMTLFSSGIGKIARGLQSENITEEGLSSIKAGMTTIFNLQNRSKQQCKQDGVEMCFAFSPGKESAASAILMMYMEFMDFMIDPSPPLMLRRDMKVTALYNGEPYDLATYESWPTAQKTAYRKEYLQFCARYMNVGFTFTSQRGPHGMKLLNLDSWGEGEIVVNPFRVKEDTLLFKYFGSFRLQPNRLGIGAVARRVWLGHSIQYDFDPTYCATFEGKKKLYYPRPIFDLNYVHRDIYREKTPRFSQLYCNVPMNVPNGPIAATKLRTQLNDVERYWKLDPMTLHDDLRQSKAIDPKWFEIDLKYAQQEPMSREAIALWNINTNWRSSARHDTDVFRDVVLSQATAFEVVKPAYPSNEGSVLNEDGVTAWQITETCFASIYGSIPLECVREPPHLNNALLHPFFNTVMSADGPWSSPRAQTSWNYPLMTITGKVSQPLFPICARARAGNWKPYEQEIPRQFEFLPRSTTLVERWDLRIALVCLLGEGANDSLKKMFLFMRHHADIINVNDLHPDVQCVVPDEYLLDDSLPLRESAELNVSDRRCDKLKDTPMIPKLKKSKTHLVEPPTKASVSPFQMRQASISQRVSKNPNAPKVRPSNEDLNELDEKHIELENGTLQAGDEQQPSKEINEPDDFENEDTRVQSDAEALAIKSLLANIKSGDELEPKRPRVGRTPITPESPISPVTPKPLKHPKVPENPQHSTPKSPLMPRKKHKRREQKSKATKGTPVNELSPVNEPVP
jgi:hypothetical protein